MSELKVLITREQIAQKVKELGAQITKDFAGQSVILVGVLKGAARELDFHPMLTKRLTHMGSTLRSRSADDKAQIIGELEAQVWPLIRAGQLKPLIHATFALNEANRAHELIDSGQHIGKIVLETGPKG